MAKMLRKFAIVFATLNQALAFKVEMSGQLSDGNWENSRPHDHWKNMCDAEIGFSADPNQQGCYGFSPMRKYNFADKELIEVVGERCRNTVVLYNMYPKLKTDNHWDYSFLTESASVEQVKSELSNIEKYWREKHKRAFKAIGMTAKQAPAIFEAMIAQAYTLKDLRKELKEMSKIVNTSRYHNELPKKGITWVN